MPRHRRTLVTIGIDPHKRTHTAVAVDEHRQQLARASPARDPRRWRRGRLRGRLSLARLGRARGDHGAAAAGRPVARSHRSSGASPAPTSESRTSRRCRRRDPSASSRTADSRRAGTPLPPADAFASYTGTAPIEVSSGDAVRHRLSRAGNRKLNTALHLVAHVQRMQAQAPGTTTIARDEPRWIGDHAQLGVCDADDGPRTPTTTPAPHGHEHRVEPVGHRAFFARSRGQSIRGLCRAAARPGGPSEVG